MLEVESRLQIVSPGSDGIDAAGLPAHQVSADEWVTDAALSVSPAGSTVNGAIAVSPMATRGKIVTR